MKNTCALLAVMLTTAALLATACGSKTKLDTSQLETAFASAPPEVKTHIDEATAALKNGNLPPAANALLAAVEKGHEDFSEPQKEAMYNIVEQIQKVMAESPERDSQEVHDIFRKLVPGIEGQAPLTVPTYPQ